MQSTSIKAWVSILLVAMLGFGGYYVYRWYETRGDSSSGNSSLALVNSANLNYPVGDFTLTDRFGDEFHASGMQGQVWVGSFFFTACPDVCVKLNNSIRDMLQDEFREDPVTFVSITVDPRNDDTKALDQYARVNYVERHGIDAHRWVFLTEGEGRKLPIEKIANENFKVGFHGGKITHSDRLIIVDANGTVRAALSTKDPADKAAFKKKLREVLDESQSNDEEQTGASNDGPSETAANNEADKKAGD